MCSEIAVNAPFAHVVDHHISLVDNFSLDQLLEHLFQQYASNANHQNREMRGGEGWLRTSSSVTIPMNSVSASDDPELVLATPSEGSLSLPVASTGGGATFRATKARWLEPRVKSLKSLLTGVWSHTRITSRPLREERQACAAVSICCRKKSGTSRVPMSEQRLDGKGILWVDKDQILCRE